MTAHAKLSASGAHRWMNSPGSVSAESGLPDYSSVYADEGTLAHAICEHALTAETTAFDASIAIAAKMIVKMPHLKGCVTKDFIDACQSYVDYVRAQPGTHRMYEVRVDFSQWVPDGFGTSDVVILDGGTRNSTAPSTVVDLTGPRPRILRAGPISAADLGAEE